MEVLDYTNFLEGTDVLMDRQADGRTGVNHNRPGGAHQNVKEKTNSKSTI